MSERTAVYRLYAVDGKLLYIGIAKDFGRRWAQHAMDKPWWPEVQRQVVDWYPERAAALAAEADAIRSENPLHNMMHAPPAPTLIGEGAAHRVRELAQVDPILGNVARTGLRYQRLDREKLVEQHVAAVVAALQAGKRPTEVASWSPFTATYLRKLAREAGVPPAAKGHASSR